MLFTSKTDKIPHAFAMWDNLEISSQELSTNLNCKKKFANLIFIQYIKRQDCSGGPGVNNPPCSAGDTGLILGQGTKIPYAVDQLSPHTTLRESTCHN